MDDATTRSSPPAALLVGTDPVLAAAVHRLAAAAGVAVRVCPSWDLAGAAWSGAPVVLVGADAASAAASADPPRRQRVHVVCAGAAPPGVFRDAVGLGAASVLELPEAEGWLVELLTDVADDRDLDLAAGRQAVTVGVVGGVGGAGATVLAAALALTAARQGPALLVDLDPLGPGARRVVGLDEAAAVTWRELGGSPGRLGSRALREALPSRSGVAVLGWPDEPCAPLPAALVREAVSAGRRGHHWVVLDLPRQVDADGALLGQVLGRCDHVLLVARAGLGGIASTARVAARLRDATAALGLVVRTSRGAPTGHEVARALGLPLRAEVGHDRRLDEHLDLGLGPVHRRRGALARAATGLVESLAVPR